MASKKLNSNSVVDGSLIDALSTDIFDLTLSSSDITQEATSLLVTLNLQVLEAFSTVEEWSLWLSVGGEAKPLVNSSDLIGSFDESGQLSFQYIVEKAGDGWPTLEAYVTTESGAAHSDALYELSYTTLALFEEGTFGRLIVGESVSAEASSVTDSDTFGFYVTEGENATASLTFSHAGTVSIRSGVGPLAAIGIADPTVDQVSVQANQTLEFRLDGSEAFVTVNYLCSWPADEFGNKAESASYSLKLEGGDGRILTAPSIRIGDTIAQDSTITDATSAIQVATGEEYKLGDLFKLSDGVFQLQLIADVADSIQLTVGDQTTFVSTNPAQPTSVLSSDFSNASIRAIQGSFALTAYAEFDTSLAPAGAEGLFRSGVIETSVESQAQGVTIGFSVDGLLEGGSGELTVSLKQPASADLDIYINNASGDLDLGSGESYTTVKIDQGSQTAILQATAIADDSDFISSEQVSVTAAIVTPALKNLVIAPITITVSEVLPEFSVAHARQELLIGENDLNQFVLTLENPESFSDDVTINFKATDKFELVNQSGASISSLIFSQSNPVQSLFVKISDAVVADFEASNITGTVKVGTADTNVSLPDMPLLRVAESALDAPYALTGTGLADTFYATPDANITYSGSAGDDRLVISGPSELNGAFIGGSGTDTLSITGLRSDFKTAFIDGETYLQSLDSIATGLKLTGVENVEFSGNAGTTFTPSSLNETPVPTDPVSLNLVENGSISVALSSLFTDPEGDILSYRLKYNGSVDQVPEWISINPLTAAIDIKPDYDAAGSYSFTLESTDRTIFSATPSSNTLAVNVLNMNRAPSKIAPITIQHVALSNQSEWELDFNQYFADSDGDNLSFSLVGENPEWAMLNEGVLSVADLPLPTGSHIVNLKVSDGNGGTVDTSVSVEPVDVGVHRAIAGEAIEFDVAALVAKYSLNSSDISIAWETSTDLKNWQVSDVSDGTTINITPSGSGPTFVRATANFQFNGVDFSVESSRELIKSSAPVHVDINFKPEIDRYLTEAVDFSAQVKTSAGATTSLVGSGYDLSSFTADALPSGDSFEITADAQTYLAPDVGISDVIASLRHIVKLDVLEGKAAIAADMDGSGDIGISDVISQLRQIVKLEESSGFKAVAQTADGYTDQLTADLLNSELEWVAMGDVDSSYTLDIV